MKSGLIKLLLLLALAFNITHASIIATEDHCAHEDVTEYVMEQSHSTDCGDLCDLHHLFHLTAIITPALDFFGTALHTEQPTAEQFNYHPPFQTTENKPPIA
ncbi:hypothetical protein [Sulfurovum riftiae]|uniref:Cobalt transporter n=1 Tax=Sulfurovum riftiae TaxID=1630136 RepID=A0A151CGY4_9BACT|nr:hypothetical protein [Sulfurovum riftiae]KYJ86523.1 hypothetical protein AS592_06885 [Sulfurovum riftiae]